MKAAHTTSLTRGTLVIDNDFRHPAVLAKEIATLDLITGGRIEIGLGAGWMTVDYDVLASIVSVNWNVGAGHAGVAAGRSGWFDETAHKIDVIRSAAGDRFETIELHIVGYFSVYDTVFEDFAPEVAALAGR